MKNFECTIYITSKHGWKQKYRKGKDGWIQTSSNGIERSLSAEQLLSHILPLLAGIGHFIVRVESDSKINIQPQPQTQTFNLLSIKISIILENIL